MGFQKRARKRRLKNFTARKEWNGGPDRVFGKWEMIDVQQIHSPIKYEDEFDFWCSDGNELYLLRLRRCRETKYFAAKSRQPEAVMYLVVERDCKVVNDALLEDVWAEYEKLGIPRYRPHRMHLRLK
jgi:hypothetical protein